MPAQIKTYDPSGVLNKQVAILQDVTETTDGLMTSWMLLALLALINAPPPKPVTKILTVSQADNFSKAFTWDVPFAGAYTFQYSVQTTADTAGVVVTVDQSTFGAAGFTFLFSNKFDGEIQVWGLAT